MVELNYCNHCDTFCLHNILGGTLGIPCIGYGCRGVKAIISPMVEYGYFLELLIMIQRNLLYIKWTMRSSTTLHLQSKYSVRATCYSRIVLINCEQSALFVSNFQI